MVPYRLVEYFPNFITDGAIFSKMPNAPWVQLGDSINMDISYLASFSGMKHVSGLIKYLTTDGVLDQQKLADILWSLFGHNWQRLWDAYMAEYDPLNNYSIEEKIQRNTNTDRTIDRDISESGTVDSTDKYDSTTKSSNTGSATSDGTTTTEYGKKVEGSAETDSFTHAFNTVDGVPTGITKSTTSELNSGTDSTTNTSKSQSSDEGSMTVDSTEKVDTVTAAKTADDTKDVLAEVEDITRTRKGNIGQNTYQELLRQEFELWKFNFYRQVFADCDSVLCLSVFSGFCDHIHDRFSIVN